MSALPQTLSALPQTVSVRPTAAARPLNIPAPRPAPDRSARADLGDVRIPSPRVPSDIARPAVAAKPAEHGRHRAAVAAMSRTDKALLIAGRAGSLTTLAALLVMSAAFAGVFDGSAPTGPAAQVATTTLQ